MKNILAAIIVMAGLFSCPASANVVYRWITTSATGPLAEQPEQLRPKQFVVTDEAFASGSMTFRIGQCPFHHRPCTIDTGDATGFVPGDWEFIDLGILDVDVVFNADGSTLTGKILQGGVFSDFQTSGAVNEWAGYFASDGFPSCNSSVACKVTGYWARVPEPATLALFVLPLAALGWLRRRFI